MNKEFKASGRDDYVFVSINDSSASQPSQQKMALGKQQQVTFPVLQGTGGSWTQGKMLVDCKNRKGKKNDGFFFAPDGRFIRKHEGKGTVYMNVWEDDIRAAMAMKIEDLDGCSCQDVKDATKKIHHVSCE